MMNHGFLHEVLCFLPDISRPLHKLFFSFTRIRLSLTISLPKHPDAQPQTRFSQAKSHKIDLELNQVTHHASSLALLALYLNSSSPYTQTIPPTHIFTTFTRIRLP